MPNSAEVFAELVRQAGVPHLEQYIGVLLIDPAWFQNWRAQFIKGDGLFQHLTAAAVNPKVQDPDPADPEGPPDVERPFVFDSNGIAHIPVVGYMTKYGSSLSAMRRGTIGVRRQVRAALVDSEVRGVFFRIDSPGGQGQGVGDLADDVARLREAKPTVAFIEDMGASGAYWVASQAELVYANASGLVGSIGAFTILDDLSKLYEEAGIKTYVLRSGEFKAIGIEGEEIPPEHRAEIQNQIEALAAVFYEGVGRGRDLSAEVVQARWGDARVHMGWAAERMGLVDGVETMDGAYTALLKMVERGPPATATVTVKESTAMENEKTTTPAAATVAEIEAACNGAPPEFVLAQLKAGATLQTATTAWTKAQAERVAELEAANAALETKATEKDAAAKAATEAPGQPPHEFTAAETGEPGASEMFWELVEKEQDRAKTTRDKAMSRVVARHPAAHAAFLAEYNEKHNRPMLTPERV